MEDWIWLAELFGYGSDKPRELLSRFDSPAAIRAASREELEALGFLSKAEIQSILNPYLEHAAYLLQLCREKKISVLTFGDDAYPQRLRNIFAPPMVLYYLGNLGMLDEEPSLAVVGTRNASTYGTAVTERLCAEVAEAGVTIVSGCAVGIDAAAHYGALRVGGRTVGVLGCGLDINYPSQNHELKRSILRRGALISELPPGTNPLSSYFPIRNRLLAGLSLGVLIGEAPKRSGALITANHAIEQGKDVFCIPPHNIYDSRYLGVAPLIRDGATVLCSAEQLLDTFVHDFPHMLDAEKVLGPYRTRMIPKKRVKSSGGARREKDPGDPPPRETASPAPEDAASASAWETLTELQQTILSALQNGPLSVDELAQALSLPAASLFAELTLLELEGLVQSMPGNRFARGNAPAAKREDRT